MHRIDTPTAQLDKFGQGKNGFTGGNPQTGQLPTALDEDFFDAVQEEISQVIEGAGIELDKDDKGQLLAALGNLFLKSGNNFSEIKDAGSDALAAALANLGLGEAAKRSVGNGADQIPDMSFFTSGPGWCKFPNGLILQTFGFSFSEGQTTGTAPYPIPFTQSCDAISFSGASSTAQNPGILTFDRTVSLSSAKWTRAGSTAGTGVTCIAMGR